MKVFDPSTRSRSTPVFASEGAQGWGRRVGGGLVAALLVMGPAVSLVATGAPAAAGVAPLYAYAGGGAKSPTSCLKTTVRSGQCTLTEALSLARAGSTVALATPGSSRHYFGNWAVNTPGTTSSAPLTIEPAAGVKDPTLDGNQGDPKGCETKTCEGPVLTIGVRGHVDLDGVTIHDADNNAAGLGGGVENIRGGALRVSHCTFTHDYAYADGGAIDNGDDRGSGTLDVSASTFSYNDSVAGDGAGIDNADNAGTGTVVVSGSTFSSNNAENGDGGAIDSGDTNGDGSLVVRVSSFLGNLAGRAGAIDNADNARGTLTITGSTFSDNVSVNDDGGAIDNADWGGQGTLNVSSSTFVANKTIGDGGAIDNADGMTTSQGTVTISGSTFARNISDVHGGAIGNADEGSKGTISVWASTLSANTANNIYAAKGQGGGDVISTGSSGTVWAAADIFDGHCLWGKGTWDDEGYNVGNNGTCLSGGTGDVGHGANRLGPLVSQGGPTKTALPLEGNPALGVIPYRTTVRFGRRTVKLCPTADQRGTRTGTGRRCDAGATQS